MKGTWVSQVTAPVPFSIDAEMFYVEALILFAIQVFGPSSSATQMSTHTVPTSTEFPREFSCARGGTRCGSVWLARYKPYYGMAIRVAK